MLHACADAHVPAAFLSYSVLQSLALAHVNVAEDDTVLFSTW